MNKVKSTPNKPSFVKTGVKVKENIVAQLEYITKRKLLAGWDKLENCTKYPSIENLSGTRYYLEAIGYFYGTCETFGIYDEAEINFKLNQMVEETFQEVLEKGCKAAYYLHIGQEVPKYAKSYKQLEEDSLRVREIESSKYLSFSEVTLDTLKAKIHKIFVTKILSGFCDSEQVLKDPLKYFPYTESFNGLRHIKIMLDSIYPNLYNYAEAYKEALELAKKEGAKIAYYKRLNLKADGMTWEQLQEIAEKKHPYPTWCQKFLNKYWRF